MDADMLKGIEMSKVSYAEEQLMFQRDINEENSELHAIVTYLEENWTQVASKVSEKDNTILELQEENMKLKELLTRLQADFEQMVSVTDSFAKENTRLKRCLELRAQADLHLSVALESSC